MASNIVLSNIEYKVVGTRPIRHDGTDKVTGRAKYGGDFLTADLLHGKVLRSPHAHARIKSLDVAKALASPGVYAVITGEDLPVGRDSDASQANRFACQRLMAQDKVLFKGHAMAALAADSAHAAETALGLIEVEYETLTPVMNVQDSMKDGSPLLHDDVTTTEWDDDAFSGGSFNPDASLVAVAIKVVHDDINFEIQGVVGPADTNTNIAQYDGDTGFVAGDVGVETAVNRIVSKQV